MIFILSTSVDYLIEQAGFNNSEVIEVAIYFQIGLCLIAILGIIGVWHWKKRGYQTLISSYAFASFISLCSINVMGFVVNGAITYLIHRIIGRY